MVLQEWAIVSLDISYKSIILTFRKMILNTNKFNKMRSFFCFILRKRNFNAMLKKRRIKMVRQKIQIIDYRDNAILYSKNKKVKGLGCFSRQNTKQKGKKYFMQLREMIPEVDTHTHTILSGHAWSTLAENCLTAKNRGMKGLCLTEHGPAIEGGGTALYSS